MIDLSGKKFLVTGASSSVGRAVAVKISQLGGRVILNGRNMERLRQTVAMLGGEGHCAMSCDLQNLEDIGPYIKKCVQTDGRSFDGLVFSAGITCNTPIRAESLENLHHMMLSNFYAYFAILKEFASKRTLNSGGSIVAVSSRAAAYLEKSHASYACSKAALEAVSGVAAKEFAKRKIRVNTVRPEMIDTPMGASFFSICSKEKIETLYPLGALTAEDVANTIVFLLSDMSSKITGQNIYLSAGNDGSPIDFLVD